MTNIFLYCCTSNSFLYYTFLSLCSSVILFCITHFCFGCRLLLFFPFQSTLIFSSSVSFFPFSFFLAVMHLTILLVLIFPYYFILLKSHVSLSSPKHTDFLLFIASFLVFLSFVSVVFHFTHSPYFSIFFHVHLFFLVTYVSLVFFKVYTLIFSYSVSSFQIFLPCFSCFSSYPFTLLLCFLPCSFILLRHLFFFSLLQLH